jgi:hypothetical protein
MNVYLQLSLQDVPSGKLSFQERIKVMTNYVKASRLKPGAGTKNT